MSKCGTKDLDNVTRLVALLPSDEAARVLKEIKKEKDPDGKRRIINDAMKKKGIKPL